MSKFVICSLGISGMSAIGAMISDSTTASETTKCRQLSSAAPVSFIHMPEEGQYVVARDRVVPIGERVLHVQNVDVVRVNTDKYIHSIVNSGGRMQNR
jgi:hypothetical protein